jgi:hypothetical protein
VIFFSNFLAYLRLGKPRTICATAVPVAAGFTNARVCGLKPNHASLNGPVTGFAISTARSQVGPTKSTATSICGLNCLLKSVNALESEFELPSKVFADQEDAAVDQPESFSFHPPPAPLPEAISFPEDDDETEEEEFAFEFEFVGLLPLFGCLEEFESDLMTSLRVSLLLFPPPRLPLKFLFLPLKLLLFRRLWW